jgi:hypothetical protein
MSSITLALISFACIFGGALSGLIISSFVPNHHLSEDAKNVVKLGAGFLATLAALVLGLLVNSAKGTLDAMNTELTQAGAKTIFLDRVLANYGPETKELRGLLRINVVSAIDLIWPEDKTRHASLSTMEASRVMEKIQKKVRGLSPSNSDKRQLQSQALQVAADLEQLRWILIEQTQQTLPTAFLVVLLFWLTMLFASFGLLSPANPTVITVLVICALSVSGAIFLILNMNSPLDGILKVSSAPLHKTLEILGM